MNITILGLHISPDVVDPSASSSSPPLSSAQFSSSPFTAFSSPNITVWLNTSSSSSFLALPESAWSLAAASPSQIFSLAYFSASSPPAGYANSIHLLGNSVDLINSVLSVLVYHPSISLFSSSSPAPSAQGSVPPHHPAQHQADIVMTTTVHVYDQSFTDVRVCFVVFSLS
jgi:hypothetical protein